VVFALITNCRENAVKDLPANWLCAMRTRHHCRAGFEPHPVLWTYRDCLGLQIQCVRPVTISAAHILNTFSFPLGSGPSGVLLPVEVQVLSWAFNSAGLRVFASRAGGVSLLVRIRGRICCHTGPNRMTESELAMSVHDQSEIVPGDEHNCQSRFAKVTTWLPSVVASIALVFAVWPDRRVAELQSKLDAAQTRITETEQRAIRNSAFAMQLYRDLIDPTFEETGIERTASMLDQIDQAFSDAITDLNDPKLKHRLEELR